MTFLDCDGVKILIDAGLSCNEISSRLALIGVKSSEIDSIFITHEHVDHIKGVDNFASKFSIPVYAHQEVWNGLDNKLKKVSSLNRRAFSGEFEYKNMMVKPVEVPHDVVCFGFSFINDNKKISILTDLGHTNDRILDSVANSQLIYLESNYDQKMLMNGTKYPLALKMRIAGPNGHLSNDSCLDAVETLARTGTRQIVLSHLSKENNTPDLAYNYITNGLMQKGIEEGVDIRIDVASTQPGVFFRLK